MKTEAEIQKRIASIEALRDKEEVDGRMGGEDWSNTMVAIHELRWVLGE